MIYGALGRMRAGKGIIATLFAHKHHEKKYSIVSNMNFYFNGKDKGLSNIPLNMDMLEQAIANEIPLARILAKERVCLVLDELMILMDSRSAMSKDNKGLSYLAAQSAKTDMPIIYTSQLNTGVDTRMRTFAHYLFNCEKIGMIHENTIGEREKYILGFLIDAIDNQGIEPEYLTTFGISATEAEYYMKMYDTEQMVSPTKANGQKKPVNP